MQSSEELRQLLLELIYDLLAPEEAAGLRARIEKDPEVAKLFAEMQSKAQVLAEVSRLHVPKIALDKNSTSLETLPTFTPDSEAHLLREPLKTTWLHWAVTLAAMVLVMVTAGGYWRYQSQVRDIASNHVRLVVTGPAKLASGIENPFSVTTTTATGEPVSAKVQYAVFAPDGSSIAQGSERTDVDGRLAIAVPAETAASGGARLEVVAMHRGEMERMQTHLPVEPPRFVTQLSLDKPLYQPGETVYFRSLSLSRFGMRTLDFTPIHFEIQDPSGAVVAGSELDGLTEKGVGNGAFTIPEGQPGGKYHLVVRSVSSAFPEEKRPFFIRQYRLPRLKKELELTRDSYTPGDQVVADFSANRAEGGPATNAQLRVIATVDDNVVFQSAPKATASGTFQIAFTLPKEIAKGDGQLAVIVDDGGTSESIVETIPINLGKVDVKFYPEGGDLVAGLDNRVYFVGRDPLNKPVHLEGTIVDAQGKEVAKVETTYKGLGSFSFKPERGASYSFKVVKPHGITSEPKLPEVNPDRHVALSAGDGVFLPGGRIPLELRSDASDLPLVVAAYCRGVQVGQQAVTTVQGSNAIELPILPEAEGVLRITVFDYAAKPPKAIAERLVYSRPQRKLRVQVADHSEGYSPGDPVELSLIVSDESGKRVPAVLGVAVVDDSLLKMADDDTASMLTHFYLTTEIEKPEDLEKADFYLSNDAKAPAALDMLLATQGWRRFAERTLEELQRDGKTDDQITRLASLGGVVTPPSMFDNLKQVDEQYQSELAAYQDEQVRTLAWLGRLAVFGGLAVAIGVVLIWLARLAANVKFWAPALGVAAASLLIGLVWMNSQLSSGKPVATAGYATFELENTVADAKADMKALDGNDIAFPAAAPPPVSEAGLAMPLPGAAAAAAPQMPMEAAKRAANRNAMYGRNLGMDKGEAAGFGGGRGGAMKGAWGGVDALRKNLGKLQDAELRQAGAAGRPMAKMREKQLANDELADGRRRLRAAGEIAEPTPNTFTIREYSHEHLDGEPGVRTDFTETLFWHPLLVADEEGKAQIKFELSDSVTTFRVLADAQANDAVGALGRIGLGSGDIISRIPFSLEPKVPIEVNAGDKIALPVAVNNDSKDNLPVNLSLTVSSPASGEVLKLVGEANRMLDLAANQRSREYFTLDVVGQKGKVDLEVRGLAGSLGDAKRQSLTVVPPGFPVAESYAGKLDGKQEVTVRLPADWVQGSLEVSLAAFPSTLADLQKGLDGIIRQPYGCFEQASTSNYPNVLTLNYLEQHKVANPEITRRAKDFLKSGYGMLTGYECKQKGYEWFGGDPGHEALTAYGLMEFRDMAKVYDVDPAMIERTSAWLMTRRDGKGGFQRNPRALDSFGGAPQHLTDAYIVWALTESKQTGLEKEVAHVIELGTKSEDPYLLALAASCAVNDGQTEAGNELLDKLAKAQQDDGHLAGKEGSITRSGGQALKIETTALAALAWLKTQKYAAQANKAVDWIVRNRQGSGDFGSTQATILALKAMVVHAEANRKTVSGGDLIVKRNEDEIGRTTFGPGHENTISVEGIAARLEPGENQITIELSGNNQMPYALDVSYRTRVPASHPDCPVKLTTKLGGQTVKAGETLPLRAQLVNSTDKGKPMTIAILGLPAGLQPRPDQLEDMKKAGTIDYYETRAREIICYWRSLAPQRKVELKFDLVAEWPGNYTGPASRAYLYYTAEQKQWADPLSVEITK